MHRVDGWLPPVEGEIFLSELKRLEACQFKQDWNDAKQRLGREPLANELGRTTPQRNAAALAVMAQRSAALGDKPITNLPCVNIHLDWDTYQAICNEMLGFDAHYPADGRRETEAGHTVTPQQCANLLVQGHIRRVVTGPNGHILNFGVKKRYFTGGLREAIMVRDRTCTEPGCTVPARQCQVDHGQPASDGGPTDEANGYLKCAFHNGLKGTRTAKPQIVDHKPHLTWYQPAVE